MRGLVIAVVCGALALGPALASGLTLEDATFTASDTYAWLANGSYGDPTVRIAPGGTVTFSNPAGNAFHNLHFKTASPCPDVPKAQGRAPWSRTCTFDWPGTYEFVCEFHTLEGMTGRVIVEAPTPAPTATPTPEGSATPVASATPGATATPAPPSPGASAPRATTLTLSLPSRQRGTRVRGSARVPAAGSRLDVTLRVHGRRVGRWTKRALPAGTVRFSVALAARTRPLAVDVTVVLTPPGGHPLSRRQRVSVRH